MKNTYKIAMILLIGAILVSFGGCLAPSVPAPAPLPETEAVEEMASEPVLEAALPETSEEPSEEPSKTKPSPTVTFSIDCLTILENIDRLDPAKLEILPADGILYSTKTVTFDEGDTVFDLLLRETRTNNIHMEFSRNPAFDSNYIEGIGNLYEFDCGELSGWTYKVNGQGVGYGSSSYVLSDGDVVEWRYTCDQGRDVGVSEF